MIHNQHASAVHTESVRNAISCSLEIKLENVQYLDLSSLETKYNTANGK